MAINHPAELKKTKPIKANLQNSHGNLGIIAKNRAFAFSGVDVVDMNGVGCSGGAKRPAGHKNNSIAGLCPLVLDNKLIDQVREMPDVLRDRLTARYDSVMQAHLPA